MEEIKPDLYRNIKNDALLKRGVNGKAYYLDAIIWVGEKGEKWHGSCKFKDKWIISALDVRFPFIPKTFYINVVEEKINKHNIHYKIKDEKQLQEALKYYHRSIWVNHIRSESI